MAHRGGKKTAGISRDTRPKRLGVKLFSGQKTKVGSVLIRQRGTKFLPGKNVKQGKDNTLYALKEGTVFFQKKTVIGFDGRKKPKKVVNII